MLPAVPTCPRTMASTGDILTFLLDLGAAIQNRVLRAQRESGPKAWSRAVRDDGEGDTVFGLDAMVEETLVARCMEQGAKTPLVLVAEGIEPASGRFFGPVGSPPVWRILADPIDGTRGLMFDKRSAWCLLAAAPDHGPNTRLSHVRTSVAAELPTTRQGAVDTLWATRDTPTQGTRRRLHDGLVAELPVQPSQAVDLHHSFATVCDFFSGAKAPTAAFTEALFARIAGEWDPRHACIYQDQYIATGGQLCELALGRDRMVIDVRPPVHRSLGHTGALCSRPYDVANLLVAAQAGCVILDLMGNPLDAPFDLTTDIHFQAYANQELADRIAPEVARVLEEQRLLERLP